MKTIHFDSVGGASGDMILGALIGLGADNNQIVTQLKGLVDDSFDIRVEPCEQHGITGIRAHVHTHHHDAHHHHGQHEHHHRTWRDIRGMVECSQLATYVKADICAVFEQIAQAEGYIHGKQPDEVHFHEVGALDSIVDIAGACIAKNMLDVESVTVGPLPVGCGTVECQHGTYPCPAPATQELLKGMKIVRTEEPHELVTPTGAALLRVWSNGNSCVDGVAEQVSYSFGHRKLASRPNVLRATLMQTDSAASDMSCLMLESNLDDTSPELLGALMADLLDGGALEVFYTPVQMKKQRPGVLLTVLCREADCRTMEKMIFEGSTTFGIRRRLVDRTVLDRESRCVTTPYGNVDVKFGLLDGACITRAPEMEACLQVAEQCGVAVRRVYESAVVAAAAVVIKGKERESSNEE